jgi:hypothetical protein
MMDDLTCTDRDCRFADLSGWGRSALEDAEVDFEEAHRRYHEARDATLVIERSPDGRFAGRGRGELLII